jgi:glycine/D-amino acid oxidase-like deaminating enzyme
MTAFRARVLIVGAGIVGAACARALTREGFHVTVIDPNPVGSGATAAGMGHIVVMDDSEAQFSLCRYSQTLWDELEQALPPEVEFRRAGTLWVAANPEESAEVERKFRAYTERGVPAEVLNTQELKQAEPNLRPGLGGGLRIAGDSVIYPPCAARWLMDKALSQGAELRCGLPVNELGGGWVKLSDGTRLEADFSINAAGSQAPRLTPGLEIRPRKGHLVITDRYPGFCRHQVLELGYLKSAHQSDGDSVAFNVQPRATGQLLVGSSRQYDAAGSHVDPEMVQRMLQRALEFMPGLVKLSAIRAWTGFRAATPDSLPLIGPHPEEPCLYLATGHEGLGITTSLATAELLTDLLAGRTSAIPTSPYLPSRFLAVA